MFELQKRRMRDKSLSNIRQGDLVPIHHRGIEYSYRVFDIKSGGMGTVYILEKQTGEWNAVFQQMIALKTYKQSFSNMMNSEMFEKELNIWVVLEHPNILPLRKIMATSENELTAVMPFCEGSVRSLISESRSKINSKLSVQVLKQVIAGLDFAYKEYQILHLDIKPENVLMDSINSEVYRISDWGISKLLSSAMESTQFDSNAVAETCGNAGTLPYMSPDRLLGVNNNTGFDIYSCGMMLYEILFGRLPFPNNSGKNVFAQIVGGDYFENASQELRKVGNTRLAAVIKNCINPDPAQRYTGYGELLGDLLHA